MARVEPGRMIDALLTVPYLPGGGDMAGADCWGVVELWYRHVIGIALADRADHPVGHAGLNAGFDAACDWSRITAPEDHCLVVMRAGGLDAGHVGVFYGGSVLHATEQSGCVVYEPISARSLRGAITCLLRHKSRG